MQAFEPRQHLRKEAIESSAEKNPSEMPQRLNRSERAKNAQIQKKKPTEIHSEGLRRNQVGATGFEPGLRTSLVSGIPTLASSLREPFGPRRSDTPQSM
jgi:hypothetical protein